MFAAYLRIPKIGRIRQKLAVTTKETVSFSHSFSRMGDQRLPSQHATTQTSRLKMIYAG
jgi:hypothetical protein